MSPTSRAALAAASRWVVVAVAAYTIARAELAWLTADEGRLVTSSTAIAIARVFAVSQRSSEASWKRTLAHPLIVSAATIAIAWMLGHEVEHPGRDLGFVGDSTATLQRIALVEGVMTAVWMAASRAKDARGPATWALALVVASLAACDRSGVAAVVACAIAIVVSFVATTTPFDLGSMRWTLAASIVAIVGLASPWVGDSPPWIGAKFPGAHVLQCPESSEVIPCPSAADRRFAIFNVETGPSGSAADEAILIGVDKRAPLGEPLRGAELFCKLGGDGFSGPWMDSIVSMLLIAHPGRETSTKHHPPGHLHIVDRRWDGLTYRATLIDENDTRARTLILNHETCAMTLTPAPMPKL